MARSRAAPGCVGPFAADAEVARRGDDAAAQVVLPEAIDDHAGQQVPGPVLGVGDPVGEGGPAVRQLRALRRRPSSSGPRPACSTCRIARRRDPFLLVRVAAAQEVRLLQEVLALRVQPDRRQPFGRDQRLDDVRLRRLRQVVLDLLVELLPAGVEQLYRVQQQAPSARPFASRRACRAPSSRLGDARLRADRAASVRVRQRQSRPADAVADVVVELERDRSAIVVRPRPRPACRTRTTAAWS